MVELYSAAGLDVYEATHYAGGEAVAEVDEIVSWFVAKDARILDLGCSGGLHALEFARRGHRVTGVDLEPTAIERGQKRSGSQGIPVKFLPLDIARGNLTVLGRFDLVYSIGNVLSHLPKEKLGGVLGELAALLDEGGVLLFDLLLADERIPASYLEETTNILWKRQLDMATGRLTLEGDFRDFAVSQKFDVWAYGVGEAIALLENSGFTSIAHSTSLAIDKPLNPAHPAPSAKFRAKRRTP